MPYPICFGVDEEFAKTLRCSAMRPSRSRAGATPYPLPEPFDKFIYPRSNPNLDSTADKLLTLFRNAARFHQPPQFFFARVIELLVRIEPGSNIHLRQRFAIAPQAHQARSQREVVISRWLQAQRLLKLL